MQSPCRCTNHDILLVSCHTWMNYCIREKLQYLPGDIALYWMPVEYNIHGPRRVQLYVTLRDLIKVDHRWSCTQNCTEIGKDGRDTIAVNTVQEIYDIRLDFQSILGKAYLEN